MTTTPIPEKSMFEKIGTAIRNSVMLKLLVITILMLLLLIPASMVQSIITERETLQSETLDEVSSKWATSQTIKGPVLTIPLAYSELQEGEWVAAVKNWQVLPEELVITGMVDPKELQRGIYQAVVYSTKLKVRGKFTLPEPPEDPLVKSTYMMDQGFLTIGISDLRGIQENIQMNWNDMNLEVQPGSNAPTIAKSGVTILLPELAAGATYTFSFDLDLQGSWDLSFIPVGSTTNVSLSSPWSAPKFVGNFLPDERNLENGFDAQWSILELNRNYPSNWTSNKFDSDLNSSKFGVELLQPVDDYAKSNRSAKYAALTITLTFLIFFLVEILNKRRIHPFQYVLVGLALCLFYVLLVALSEHLGFNAAYGIATLGIVSMITLYSISVFKEKKLVFLLFCTLCAIYGFLFVTLQMVDYALLMGSIGLALILAATMYFTRNINWYKLNAAESVA